MLSLYQNLPQHVNPVVFRIGSFSLRWYSLMYLLALLVFYLLLRYRLKKEENRNKKIDGDLIINYLFWSFTGLIIGARLGHVLIYSFSYYIKNPLEIISPFNSSGEYVGIYGMSYFGGLSGAVLASWIFIKKNKLNIRDFSDFIIPAVPAGYFFGRIGNFLNGELYGKMTERPWGMYFQNAPGSAEGLPALRHPSQIYEAILEGLALFAIFWIFRNNPKWRGNFLSFYLIGYGLARFFCEFFREPEEYARLITTGQFFSIAIIFCGLIILRKKKNRV